MNFLQKKVSINTRLLLGVLSLSLLFPLNCLADFAWEDHYTFEDIAIPKDIDPQIGGMALNGQNQLVVCFHRGEVMIHDDQTNQWSLFASGLQEPLGLYVEKAGTILVIQRGELTRLHDTDQNGTADFYETVSNNWGVSGNYHEFTFGIVKDTKGNIYLGLGTASNGAGVRKEIRGPWNDTGGMTQEDFLSGGKHGDWKEKKSKVSRMYARVPYRGCIIQIKPDSPKSHVYATGLRTPNGLHIDAQDQLWVSDNQGDWLGASKLHRIEKNGFHGHPASLLWAKNPPSITPAKLPAKELNAMRVKAAGLFPQGDCANSITQLQPFSTAFGPLSKESKADDQFIIGEMNNPRIIRYLPDLVNGVHQGTAGHLLSTKSLGIGNNRMIYSSDSTSIYLGKTHLKWPGDEGIKKITYKGTPYLIVESVKLTPKGFQFTFNAPIRNAENLQQYKVQSYGLLYSSRYGSPKQNLTNESCDKISVDGENLTIELTNKPKANKIYDIKLPKEITSNLSDLSSSRFWYTTHAIYE